MYYYVDHLEHHGILGQKWGVRRYQNKDGSLTAEGKARLQDLRKQVDDSFGGSHHIGQLNNELFEREKADAGISSVDKDTDVLKKGSAIYRITTEGEPVDSKRKYVSLLYDDRLEYESESDVLPLGEGEPVQIKYEAKKNVKIANLEKTQEEIRKFMADGDVKSFGNEMSIMYGEKRAKQLIKTYGNLKVSELDYDPHTLQELYSVQNEVFSKKEQKKYDWMKDYLDVGYAIVSRQANNIALGRNGDDFYKHMQKLGYDAFIDPYDAIGGSADYPVVFIDPSKTMKKVSEKKMN